MMVAKQDDAEAILESAVRDSFPGPLNCKSGSLLQLTVLLWMLWYEIQLPSSELFDLIFIKL